ncbi:MAG: hypothetical protein LCH73_10750 [Proteobacteria bacterium]|nr:hypothetical protein [Pseudomonadota bacterium]
MSTSPFTIPGFDFLQQLGKQSSNALPGLSNLTALQQWATPTLDPAELDKRIDELRTVQFWLEQNAKLIATTIQTLEVQRMTLSALQAMNVSMTGLRDAVTPATKAAAKPEAKAPPKPTPAPPKPAAKADADTTPSAAAQAAATGMVDPMQWWQALTTQFSQLAQQAVQPEPGAKKAAAVPAKAAAKKAAPRKRP